MQKPLNWVPYWVKDYWKLPRSCETGGGGSGTHRIFLFSFFKKGKGLGKKLDKKLERKKKLDCGVAFTGGRTGSLTLKNLVLVRHEFSSLVAYQC